jgi:hypothetical protein
MKASTEILNRAVKDAQGSIEYARKNMQFLKNNRRMLGRVLNAICKALGERKRNHMFVSSSGDIYITMNELPGFKCMELEMVLNTLENLGTVKSTEDHAQYRNRDYRYVVNGVDVYLNAYVTDDSETCKRVAVGTKTTEQVIYEMRCS